MGILLIILYVIGGLIALFLIAALFAKKNYTIQRSFSSTSPANWCLIM
jgi:hypothetical protein